MQVGNEAAAAFPSILFQLIILFFKTRHNFHFLYYPPPPPTIPPDLLPIFLRVYFFFFVSFLFLLVSPIKFPFSNIRKRMTRVKILSSWQRRRRRKGRGLQTLLNELPVQFLRTTTPTDRVFKTPPNWNLFKNLV